MRPQDSAGGPLLTISIRRIPNSEVTQVPASGYSFAGYAYEIEPTGATFDPYVTFAITIPENEWSGLKDKDLSIKWFNAGTSAWEDIPTTVSSETRTVSAKITHTSIFALFVARPPTTQVVTEVTTMVPATPINGGFPMDMIIRIVILVIIVIAAVLIILFFLKKRKKPAETLAEPPAEDWDIKGLQ